MKKEFKKMDEIHVPTDVKLDLYEKIEKNEMEDHKMKRRIRNTAIAMVAIILLIAIPLLNGNDVLDMNAYLKASETQVEQPLQGVLEKKKELDGKLERGEITLDEYFTQMEALKTQRSELLKKQEELNKEYKVNAENIAKSEQKQEVEAYLQKLKDLEAQDDALDAKEDQLEKEYRNGTLSKEEFLKQKQALEAQDDALDQEENQIESVIGDDDQYDKNDHDDDDDNDDDDDDNDDLDDHDDDD